MSLETTALLLAGLFAALATIPSCQSADSTKQAELTPQSARLPATAPDAANGDVDSVDGGRDAATENAAQLDDDARFMLPEGRYWIRRKDRISLGSGTSAKITPDGIVEKGSTRQEGSTRCHPLELASRSVSGERRIVELRMFLRISSGMSATEITFYAGESEHGWLLHSPDLERGRVKLSGQCRQELRIEPPEENASFMESNAGPLFLDEESCHAAPSHYVETCQEGGCQYEEPAARPLVLNDCESTIATLRTRAGRVLATSHDAAMQSLVELDKRARKGGELWEWVGAEDVCGQVSVTPQEDNRVRLSLRYPISDDGYDGHVEDKSVYWLAPAFRYARLYSRFHERHYDDEDRVGGAGGGSSSSGREQGLYVADGAILLGERWLYFERSACEARSTR